MPEYKCKTCGIRFDTWAELTNHSYQKHDDLYCPVCGVRFHEAADIKRHESEVHTAVGVTF
jgi:DNA-directed RNA polymerase subunit RPC12/RpoP